MEVDQIMDKSLAEKFFSNIKWFNTFFHDLKTLLDKITSKIEGYDKKIYYYPKSNDIPAIPPAYYVLLGSDDKLTLNIVVVLDKDFIKNTLIKADEPIIFFVLHNYVKYNSMWLAHDLLQDKNLLEIKSTDGFITGILHWGKNYPEVNFFSFIVPLSIFIEYSDNIVQEKIVEKINKIQNMYDESID